MGMFDFLKKKEADKEEKTESVRPSFATYQDYITYIGDTYVRDKQLELSDQDLSQLSVNDGAEAIRLYNWLTEEVGMSEDSDEQKQEKIERLLRNMCEKLFEEEAIYAVYSRHTGFPFLFSTCYAQEDGRIMCTDPQIRIFTEQSVELTQHFETDDVEVRKIENGEDQQGIKHFLEECAFIHGALGVQCVYDQAAIHMQALVSPPDFSHLPEIQRPITNPDVTRWLLLMAQLGQAETEDAKRIYMAYCDFMDRELPKARFLVPGQLSTSKQADENGLLVSQAGDSMKLALKAGADDTPILPMYTDWLNLRAEYGEDYNGFIMTIEDMIETYDIALNPVSQYARYGVYITKELFAEMKAKQV